MCHKHALNLSISQSSKVLAIRNAVCRIKDTTFLLNASAKRSAVLTKKLEKKLTLLCETRWIERHDSITQFRCLLPKIVNILSCISKWKDVDTALKAQGLVKSLSNSETIVAIICLSDLLTCTKSLSEYFQRVNIDILSAKKELDITFKLLNRRREKSDQYFKSLFDEIKGVAQELGVEIKVPRITKRQVHRENYPSDDPETYYRR